MSGPTILLADDDASVRLVISQTLARSPEIVALFVIFSVGNPAFLAKLALIVRAADTGRPELSKEAEGLLAISRGLSINFKDDHAMLAQGMVVYDALYAACGGDIRNAKPKGLARAP